MGNMRHRFLAVITLLALPLDVLSPPLKGPLDTVTRDGGVAIPQDQGLASKKESSTVNGLINQSVDLSIAVGEPPTQVTWKFDNSIQTFKIADIEDNDLQPHYHQFAGRLEALKNGTVLRIKDTTKADKGIYYAHVTLEDHQLLILPYDVRLFEAVPTPCVNVTEINRTNESCNVVLHCSVPNTSNVSYSWKYRHGDSDYHEYNSTAATIQMPVSRDSRDLEVWCIVHNPASKKNVSIRVTPCQQKGERSSFKVIGLLNQSVDLSIAVGEPPTQVTWKFDNRNQTFKIAEIEDNDLQPHYHQFTGRLEALKNGTVLRIKDSTKADEGIYYAYVTLVDHQLLKFTYYVTLYEAVPTPCVNVTEINRTNESCNVVLHCSVPNTSNVSYSWKYRHGDSDYHEYNSTAATIQMPVSRDSRDLEVWCIVHNPASKKNVSIRVTPCQQKGERSSFKVIGLLNQSVDLSIAVGEPPTQVTWKFDNRNQTFKIAEIEDNDLQPHYHQFTGRLEALKNGTVLRIKDSTKADEGIYYAYVTLVDHQLLKFTYYVTLYEAVPTPSVNVTEINRTNESCNVVLHCSVPNTSNVSYSWKYRHGDSDYHEYNSTAATIQMPVSRDSRDLEVWCIVHNPASKKNVSIRVTPCQQKENRHHYFLIPAILLLLGIFGCIIYKTWDLKLSAEESWPNEEICEKSKDFIPIHQMSKKEPISLEEETQEEGV
ncbi:basement membrane-specific heparan sulfate proteoglycan core protein-like isoform X2 [Hyperolius riggenbachi]|uniref:basement membrane-specific heparan sulfate proteoglycan core protein-like isoform X2 n=1 Tax=Hyperolius riggenbachi TaxID=752182 RepID=UPI0035A2C88E